MGKIPEKLMLIVNPTSGGGKSLDMLPEIDKLITGMGGRPDIRISNSAGDATRLASLASQSRYDRVIAVGGDGTVNMVATGLAGSETILGIIPAGTGNDFFSMLDISKSLEDTVKVALRGDPVETDIGRVNDNLFFNMVGIGFDALIANSVSKQTKRRGLATYLMAIFENLKDYSSHPIKLRVDRYEIDHEILMLAVGIGRSSGKGFKLTPSAKPDDGKFDVCLVKYIKPIRIVRMLPRVLKGKHVRIPEVEMYRCRQLEILSQKPLPIQYEGETTMSTNGKISIKMSREKLQVAAGVKVTR